MKTFLTQSQLQEFLHCSKSWIYAHKHEIPVIKLGKKVLYDFDDVVNFAVSKKQDIQQNDKEVNEALKKAMFN